MILGAFLTTLGLGSEFSTLTEAGVAFLAGVPVPVGEDSPAARFRTGVLFTFLRSEGGT